MFIFQRQQEAGNAQSSYVTHSYEKISSPEDEHMVQWAAFSLYSGGSDTVGILVVPFAYILHAAIYSW